MNQIRISDVTMKQTGPEISLSFREKIELSKLLDNIVKQLKDAGLIVRIEEKRKAYFQLVE